MSDELKKTIDVSQKEDGVSEEGEPKAAKGDALSSIKRPLTEKELKNNPAAVQLILDMAYKQEKEIEELQKLKDKYYEEKESASVLREEIKSLKSSTNSKFIFVAIGSLVGGYLPSLYGRAEFFPLVMFAAVFLLVGFFKK